MAKWETLRENKEFRTLYYRGKSRVDAAVVTYVRPNRLGYPRIGITTGKKIGNAVTRNRCRRVIRAALAPLYPSLGGVDIVFVARARMPQLKSTELQPILEQHLRSLGAVRR